MRYEDDRYLDNEEDNDLWDDELEISSDHIPPAHDYMSEQSLTTDDNEDQYVSENPELRQSKDSEHFEDGEDYYSDPETKDTTTPKEGFFKKKAEDEDDEDNDYFDSDDEPTPVKKQKIVRLDPEDPDYWIEEDESPISSIIHSPRKKWKWWLAGGIAVLTSLIFIWVWFLHPYSDSAVKYGYIKNMERRGSIIKTFEGSMIPYKELGDPDPLYFKEIRFSVESDSLAAVMKRMMLGCVPVRVEYEMYHAPLPWKGEEKMIINKADTADPRKILPPEYRKQ